MSSHKVANHQRSRRHGRRWLRTAVCVAVAVVTCGASLACQVDLPEPSSPGQTGADDAVAIPAADNTRPAGSTRRQVLRRLAKVTVVNELPTVAGYDRDCDTGHGCSFGPDWTDDTTAAYGHNGCGTRDDMLRAELQDVVLRPGTHGCVVEAGVLPVDPYTGQRRVRFTKEQPTEVQVDHLVPLSRAWRLGAAQWPLQRRERFANDPANLVLTGTANQAKGDSGPGEWMPLHRAYVCTYLARYLAVSITYRLPITQADADAVRHTADYCPRRSPQRSKETR
jgi:hypothetical protein